MAKCHIRLQYISKQHTGAENAFLLRIFNRCAAKTQEKYCFLHDMK